MYLLIIMELSVVTSSVGVSSLLLWTLVVGIPCLLCSDIAVAVSFPLKYTLAVAVAGFSPKLFRGVHLTQLMVMMLMFNRPGVPGAVLQTAKQIIV